jgi:hypothetical protein
MPANTVKIDRTTMWGNPFKIGTTAAHPATGRRIRIDSAATSIELYTAWLKTDGGAALAASARKELRGRNLACWCAAGSPCHGDVLLKLVNRAG